MTTVNEVIKRARERVPRLNQEALAELVRERNGSRFSRQSLSAFERGESKSLEMTSFAAICEILGIDMRAALEGREVRLLGDVGSAAYEVTPIAQTKRLTHDAHVAAYPGQEEVTRLGWISVFDALTERQKGELLRLAEDMARENDRALDELLRLKEKRSTTAR